MKMPLGVRPSWFTLVAITIYATGLGGCQPSEPSKDAAPASQSRAPLEASNQLIVLITVDTLRTDRLGAYGYPKPTSPNIDRFAKQATVFESCFAHSSATRTSLASLLTGFLPHEVKSHPQQPLPSAVDSIAEMLREKGFRSAAVVGNYVLRGERGWSQGFDVYDDEMDAVEENREWPERRAESTATRANELMRAYQDEPLFLWVHFQDPHGPYTPPEEFKALFGWSPGRSKQLKFNDSLSGRSGLPSYQRLGDIKDLDFYQASYDSEIRYMDSYFGRVIDQIRILGRYDDALIILTSDHGEAMGERDLYFSHGEYLYENLTRVPLILKQGSDMGRRRNEPCQHLDIVPTILGFVGEAADPRFRGRNLANQGIAETEIVAFAKSPVDESGSKYSIRSGDFKLIHNLGTGQIELFNVVEDPYETNDIASAAESHKPLRDLTSALRHVLNDDRLRLEFSPGQAMDEEELEGLRALGYVE